MDIRRLKINHRVRDRRGILWTVVKINKTTVVCERKCNGETLTWKTHPYNIQLASQRRIEMRRLAQW